MLTRSDGRVTPHGSGDESPLLEQRQQSNQTLSLGVVSRNSCSRALTLHRHTAPSKRVNFFMAERLELATQWLSNKPPVLWKIGETLTKEELATISPYGTQKALLLFESTRDGGSYKIEGVPCCCCNRDFEILEACKTKVGEVITDIRRVSGKRKLRCPDCLEMQRKERLEKNPKEELAEEKRLRTEEFITAYLSTESRWIIPAHKWFRALEEAIFWIDQEEVERKIKDMDYSEFLKTPYWKAVAHHVRYRAKFRCQICNNDGDLHVHHRNYSIHGSEHRNIHEMTCVCRDCHQLHHEERGNQ